MAMIVRAAPEILKGLEGSGGAGGAGGGGGGGGSGATELVNTLVPLADGISHIMDSIREQQNKARDQALSNDNEFNIRKNFLDNTVDAIRGRTLGQYNIVICTNQEKDDFQNLTGRLLGLDLVDIDVAQGKTVNFQVYLFDTGKYLRRGRWERDAWWWWGNGTEKTFYDVNMHVHFETAQPKMDQAQVKAEMDKRAEDAKKAADANAAAKAAEDKAKADSAAELKKEADQKAADAKAAAENQATAAGNAPPPSTSQQPVDPSQPQYQNPSQGQYQDPNLDPNQDPNQVPNQVPNQDPNQQYQDPYQDPNQQQYQDPSYQDPNQQQYQAPYQQQPQGQYAGTQAATGGPRRTQPQQAPPTQQQPQYQPSYLGQMASFVGGQALQQLPRYAPQIARQGLKYAIQPRRA